MVELYRAMISSTTKDMLVHRQQALDACLRQDFLPVMMEHLPPSPDDAVRQSLSLVDGADVYLLVLGLCYGEIPPGYEKSYTHLELDRAIERGIPILVLLTSPYHLFAETDVDVDRERVLRLREEVQRHGVSCFSSPEDLRSLLIDGLSNLCQRLPPRSASTQHANRPDPPPAPFVVGPYTLLQTAEVVGRQRELDLLTDWVSNPGKDVHRARVLALLAIGGMGKSAIAWKWFHDIAPQELPTLAGRVWWSFYETDARFDNFVLRTLGYVTGRSVQELRTLRAPEREEELLGILDREPYLACWTASNGSCSPTAAPTRSGSPTTTSTSRPRIGWPGRWACHPARPRPSPASPGCGSPWTRAPGYSCAGWPGCDPAGSFSRAGCSRVTCRQ